MDTPTPTPTPTPPLTGVRPVQNAAAEIVSEMPPDLKATGGLSQYPVTSMVQSLRLDENAIRGDAPLLMLQYLVQGIEQKALVEHQENIETAKKLELSQSEVTRLSVENAVLKKDVAHKDSDKNVRTVLVALGAMGIGIAGPIVIGSPTPVNIFFTAVLVAVFVCGLVFPSVKGGAS